MELPEALLRAIDAIHEDAEPWLAIFPKLLSDLERRVAIFSEMLELEPSEVAAWSLVHGVLSACWSLDYEPFDPALKVALALGELCQRLDKADAPL